MITALCWFILALIFFISFIVSDLLEGSENEKKRQDLKKKRELEECQKFNAENEGVNFLYRRS
jgi:hypothetical protein